MKGLPGCVRFPLRTQPGDFLSGHYLKGLRKPLTCIILLARLKPAIESPSSPMPSLPEATTRRTLIDQILLRVGWHPIDQTLEGQKICVAAFGDEILHVVD